MRLTARGGGIQAANLDQWQMFMPKIRLLNLPYVVVLLDVAPQNFSRRPEAELFHQAMTQLRDEGYTVFVVFPAPPGEEETTLTMRDNIRYVQTHTNSIRFWTDSNRIWWSE